MQDKSGSISDIARVVMAELAAECRKHGTLEEEEDPEEVSGVTEEEEVADLEEQFRAEDQKKSSVTVEGTATTVRNAKPLKEIEDEVTEETLLLFRDRVRIKISRPSLDIGSQFTIFPIISKFSYFSAVHVLYCDRPKLCFHFWPKTKMLQFCHRS